MKLEKLLSLLNISSEEAQVYLQLLRGGPSSVGALAKKIGKRRTTLYSVLRRLVQKGLIFEERRRGIVAFSAESPQRLIQIFNDQIAELTLGKEQLLELVPKLQSERYTLHSVPRFSLYEGEEGLKNVLRDMLLHRDIESLSVWPIKSMIDVLSGEFFRSHNIERIRNNIFTRAIWPASSVVNIKKYPYLGWGKEFKREIRVAPKEMSFNLGYWIYGSKVAFLSSQSESFGFLIDSNELVETLSSQFEVMWKLSKPLEFAPDDVKQFLKEISK